MVHITIVVKPTIKTELENQALERSDGKKTKTKNTKKYDFSYQLVIHIQTQETINDFF
jgi:hypothetical protein